LLFCGRKLRKNFLHYSIETVAAKSQIMTTVTRTCAKCGAKIFADGPQEFCTACLLETGLGLLADEGDAAVDLASAPPKGRAARWEKMLGDFGDYELLEEVGRGGKLVSSTLLSPSTTSGWGDHEQTTTNHCPALGGCTCGNGDAGCCSRSSHAERRWPMTQPNQARATRSDAALDCNSKGD
jgi:hypothetical protein